MNKTTPNQYGDYHDRKKWRTLQYSLTQGKKLIVCSACSGSGYYDNTGSPKCGCCNGTGKVREK